MGAAESTQKLGQRVLIAKGKFESDLQLAKQRLDYLQQHSPQTLQTVLASVSDSFATCSPFLESTLLVALLLDAGKCKDIVLSACGKVLRAPINDAEYKWFTQYVFTSSIWMFKIEQSGKYMYEELLQIGNAMSSDIVASMDSIHEHLQSHKQWHKVMAIQNETLVSRQDDAEKVGLLQESGLKHVFEAKFDDDGGDEDGAQSEDVKNFIDSNLAINLLTSTASKLNDEFQAHIRLVMSSHGTFQEAPMKKVERSISKLENEYQNEQEPRAARLLDLVRCSVTFNTVEQMCHGFDAFLNHMQSNQSIIELARVKNGFLDVDDRGYRDIKINVVYESQNPEYKGVRMICEVQLLLINYLEEKKKIHKLYSVLREETFFKMVVSQKAQTQAKEAKDLRFVERLNVGKEIELDYAEKDMYKCTVDADLELLAMEGEKWFAICNMQTKKAVLSLQRETSLDYDTGTAWGQHTHQWLTINAQKYVSVQTGANQIKMFKIVSTGNSYQFVEDKQYAITLTGKQNSTIFFCDFDHDFKCIYMVIDCRVLQKRAIANVNKVVSSMVLEEKVAPSSLRNFRLSADGRYWLLAGGSQKPYFYVIDITNKQQVRLESAVLNSTFVPCFINGENQLISVADKRGVIEIWDLTKQQSIQTLHTDANLKNWITATASTHNILAIGSVDKKLRLYDVRTWTCFYVKEFSCLGMSLHLTDNLKYVTFAGDDDKGNRCYVLQID